MGDNMTAASAVMMYPGDYDGPLLEGVFQPMPELTGDEYEALKADVKARGIVTPVMVDQHGRVLDGHHRLKVARELGIVCPLIVHSVADDAEAWGLALTDDAHSRNQSRNLQTLQAEEAIDTHPKNPHQPSSNKKIYRNNSG